MIISVAQIRPVAGDLEKNIEKHKNLIALAAEATSDLIVFSELSLTGYEPRLAQDLATTVFDPMFDVFQGLSNQDELCIALGMPIQGDAGIYIGMVVFQAKTDRQIYCKQHLHEDELPYFVPGQSQLYLDIKGQRIAPAICYESLLPEHIAQVNQGGADVYLASVAKSEAGIEKGYAHYPRVAKQYGIPVVMANCVGYCDDFESVGGSAVWGSDGRLMGQMDRKSEGILSVDLGEGTVRQRVLFSDAEGR